MTFVYLSTAASTVLFFIHKNSLFVFLALQPTVVVFSQSSSGL